MVYRTRYSTHFAHGKFRYIEVSNFDISYRTQVARRNFRYIEISNFDISYRTRFSHGNFLCIEISNVDVSKYRDPMYRVVRISRVESFDISKYDFVISYRPMDIFDHSKFDVSYRTRVAHGKFRYIEVSKFDKSCGLLEFFDISNFEGVQGTRGRVGPF